MNVVRLPDRGRRAQAPQQPLSAEEYQRLRSWIERILAAGDAAGPFSIERLCRKAGVTPTNISRFMRDPNYIPRLATLARIADCAGVPPPGLTMSTYNNTLVDVPVISPQTFRANGRAAAIVASRTAVRAPAKYSRCVGVEVTTDTGLTAGILRGDMVIVDTEATPGYNDLVVVALDTGDAGIYRMQGMFLMPQGIGNHHPLNASQSTVIGVCKQVQRDL
jgi:transcriptional regulator with XRE-family HTH domain